jgi:hypothetical protein
MVTRIFKANLLVVIFLFSSTAFSQSKSIAFNWEKAKTNKNFPQREAQWLNDSIAVDERDKAIELVAALSQPASAQMLVGYAHIDGSYSQLKKYLDSLTVRPPDGDAGIVRIAYLVAKLRSKLIARKNKNTLFRAAFKGEAIKVPAYNKGYINPNIKLSFDYQPAQVLLDIIGSEKNNYNNIAKKISLHQFDMLIGHHNQSFYTNPLTKDQLITCLLIANSNKPLDVLYRYMNPDGLLYFTDVKDNFEFYKQQLKDLKQYEKEITGYINASISPLLPINTAFSRKISFFYINGSDGWQNNGVAAVDLNYYKDDYTNLLPLMVHETYHAGQSAVAINDTIERSESVQTFVDAIHYLFLEGTASYVYPPAPKTPTAYAAAVKKGTELLEDVFQNTIINYNAQKAQEIADDGIQGGGPFYYLGAEMTKVIVANLGKEKLASIIPYGGITFFKTYLEAVNKSGTEKNLLGEDVTKFIKDLK